MLPVLRRLPTSLRMKPPGLPCRTQQLSIESASAVSPIAADLSSRALSRFRSDLDDCPLFVHLLDTAFGHFGPMVSCGLHLPFVRLVTGIRLHMVVSWVPLRSSFFVARFYLALIAVSDRRL